ncbi:MAG TPA: polysaccharide deacetylase family protein [Candidatus Angelobacter sp.]|nr:polysaccharide deacetylase family protein [Candidatus Angelobacter sp.]
MPVSTELKSLGHSISFHSGISAVMARRQSCARILMYHGIAAESAQALKAQLCYLTRNFKVVSLEAMVNRLAGNRAIGANEIVLTFDDGLRNNFTVVYPILRELQLPATFFVCPGLIGSGKWLWNHEARCRLRTLSNDALTDVRTTLLAPDPSADGIVEWMKTLKLPKRQRAEECIRQATPAFQPTDDQCQAYDMMDWDELKSLDPGLIMIGSHTLTHPILVTLSQAEIVSELRESRRYLEQKLDRAIDFFCYPNGAYDARVYEAVKNNYRAAVTTETGVLNGKEQLDLHRLPRIPSAENPALTAWRLHRPEA